jgi:CTP-dependent riboflavin kinase
VILALGRGGVRESPRGARHAVIDMSELLRGRVQAGKNDASRWLSKFNHAYRQKLGRPVFPGSLNLALSEAFDWFAARYQPYIIGYDKEEYGGERDILLLPCTLVSLDGRPAHLWTPTTAARSRPDPWVIEVVCEVGLRSTYGLCDGDVIEIDVQSDVTASQGTGRT